MSRINPPPSLRLPAEISSNTEMRVYFEKLNTILFQLWTRSGGGNDNIADNSIDASIADDKATQAITLITQYIQEGNSDQAVTEAKINNALQSLEEIKSYLALLSLAPPHVPNKRIRHGMFYDTTTQTAALANTAYSVTYNSTSLSEGVYLGSPTSRIYVDTEGVYNFQFSIQLDKTSGGTASFWIWVALNGVDIADSASQVRIQGNDSEIFTAANYFLDLKAGDYVELKWAVSDVSVQLQYFAAAAPVPAIPSIIVTVSNNISQ